VAGSGDQGIRTIPHEPTPIPDATPIPTTVPVSTEVSAPKPGSISNPSDDAKEKGPAFQIPKNSHSKDKAKGHQKNNNVAG
jgi:hypothetical protein